MLIAECTIEWLDANFTKQLIYISSLYKVARYLCVICCKLVTQSAPRQIESVKNSSFN